MTDSIVDAIAAHKHILFAFYIPLILCAVLVGCATPAPPTTISGAGGDTDDDGDWTPWRTVLASPVPVVSGVGGSGWNSWRFGLSWGAAPTQIQISEESSGRASSGCTSCSLGGRK